MDSAESNFKKKIRLANLHSLPAISQYPLLVYTAATVHIDSMAFFVRTTLLAFLARASLANLAFFASYIPCIPCLYIACFPFIHMNSLAFLLI
jgi:hypothetical protein